MNTIPPLIPGAQHTVLIETDWDTTIRVPIDGYRCPGCGTPLHECQDERGVLTDHAIRPTMLPGGSHMRPAGPRRMKTRNGRACDAYCPVTADDFTVLIFRLATRGIVRPLL